LTRHEPDTNPEPAAAQPLSDSQIYYFEIGKGRWRGAFSFLVTDWSTFRKTSLSLTERFLVVGMASVHRLVGDSRIDSEVWARPNDGVAGLAGNTVRISRFGLTLYLLKETYTLNLNGHDVAVHAHERFGPIPYLFKVEKRHPAVIHAEGMSSTYYIPLLGAEWTANYTVRADRAHIDGQLESAFARATEIIRKLPQTQDKSG